MIGPYKNFLYRKAYFACVGVTPMTQQTTHHHVLTFVYTCRNALHSLMHAEHKGEIYSPLEFSQSSSWKVAVKCNLDFDHRFYVHWHNVLWLPFFNKVRNVGARIFIFIFPRRKAASIEQRFIYL